MCAEIMDVLGRAGIDVARDVEVEVVLHRDLVKRHHARVAVNFGLRGEAVHDPVDILRAQAVLVAVFDEPFGGVDHEDRPLVRAASFVDHDDTGGDARAIEQVGR